MKLGFFFIKMGVAILCFVLAGQSEVQAGAEINLDDIKKLSIGVGLRTSFSSVEDAAPNSNSRSKDFDLENMRLYITARIHKGISFAFNTERVESTGQDTGDKIRILDAVAKFSFTEQFWRKIQIPGGSFRRPE